MENLKKLFGLKVKSHVESSSGGLDSSLFNGTLGVGLGHTGEGGGGRQFFFKKEVVKFLNTI